MRKGFIYIKNNLRWCENLKRLHTISFYFFFFRKLFERCLRDLRVRKCIFIEAIMIERNFFRRKLFQKIKNFQIIMKSEFLCIFFLRRRVFPLTKIFYQRWKFPKINLSQFKWENFEDFFFLRWKNIFSRIFYEKIVKRITLRFLSFLWKKLFQILVS